MLFNWKKTKTTNIDQSIALAEKRKKATDKAKKEFYRNVVVSFTVGVVCGLVKNFYSSDAK